MYKKVVVNSYQWKGEDIESVSPPTHSIYPYWTVKLKNGEVVLATGKVTVIINKKEEVTENGTV